MLKFEGLNMYIRWFSLTGKFCSVVEPVIIIKCELGMNDAAKCVSKHVFEIIENHPGFQISFNGSACTLKTKHVQRTCGSTNIPKYISNHTCICFTLQTRKPKCFCVTKNIEIL